LNFTPGIEFAFVIAELMSQITRLIPDFIVSTTQLKIQTKKSQIQENIEINPLYIFSRHSFQKKFHKKFIPSVKTQDIKVQVELQTPCITFIEVQKKSFILVQTAVHIAEIFCQNHLKSQVKS
jgi:hypothetical protein